MATEKTSLDSSLRLCPFVSSGQALEGTRHPGTFLTRLQLPRRPGRRFGGESDGCLEEPRVPWNIDVILLWNLESRHCLDLAAVAQDHPANPAVFRLSNRSLMKTGNLSAFQFPARVHLAFITYLLRPRNRGTNPPQDGTAGYQRSVPSCLVL
jgi:hypothetical protein